METLAPSGSGASASYTGTAGNTSDFPAGGQAVLVWTTTDAYVSVGDTVTATSTSTPLPAYTPVVIKVPNTQVAFRVSAKQISAAGTVYARPVAGT